MSLDLFFYKPDASTTTKQAIGNYLEKIAGFQNYSGGNEWLYNNEDTGVYCVIEYTEPDQDDPEDEEDHPGFTNTHFTFNLNYLRPDFFGLEAFLLVEKIVGELDLYVVNPQMGAESEDPHKPSPGWLYKSWSEFNAAICREKFIEFKAKYYPLERSTETWKHNFTRNDMQDMLGEVYFVPKVLFVETRETGEPTTLTTWTTHIPNVFPKADFVCLNRDFRRLFQQVKENGVISWATFIATFGALLEDYTNGTKIIRPDNAAKAARLFNSVRFEQPLSNFQETEIDKFWNAKP
jgi:hypothetical protein